ncbi:MAG: hypothetical protein HC906_19090 [Bacteroidales bacterium]|nr:hypothetical protein [Bacteroidales bacterium]
MEFLIKENIPSISANVKKEDFTCRLICLHPQPPAPDEVINTKNRDRELLVVANRVAEQKGLTIVLGDLNDVAWSDTSYKFRLISGLKDPRKGRGFYNTYHARIPFLRWALDHVFISKEFKLIRIERLPSIGSDHFPISFILVSINSLLCSAL